MAHRRSARLGLVAAAAGLALAACGTPAESQPQPQSQSQSQTSAAAGQQHQDHQRSGGSAGQHHQGSGGSAGQHHHGSDGLQLWATDTASFGVVVLDGDGRIVYRSDADRNDPPASHCTGECTQRWVPVTVGEGQEPELLGVDRERVGTVARADGTTQVTLAGWPLYTVAGDQGDHDGTGAHGADGTWFAVTPSGEKATPATR